MKANRIMSEGLRRAASDAGGWCLEGLMLKQHLVVHVHDEVLCT